MKDVMAAVEEAHREYEASIRYGVLAVRPLGGSLCSNVLPTQIGPMAVSGRLRDVLTELIRRGQAGGRNWSRNR